MTLQDEAASFHTYVQNYKQLSYIAGDGRCHFDMNQNGQCSKWGGSNCLLLFRIY